jgi:hypothetical protein
MKVLQKRAFEKQPGDGENILSIPIHDTLSASPHHVKQVINIPIDPVGSKLYPIMSLVSSPATSFGQLWLFCLALANDLSFFEFLSKRLLIFGTGTGIRYVIFLL